MTGASPDERGSWAADSDVVSAVGLHTAASAAAVECGLSVMIMVATAASSTAEPLFGELRVSSLQLSLLLELTTLPRLLAVLLLDVELSVDESLCEQSQLSSLSYDDEDEDEDVCEMSSSAL